VNQKTLDHAWKSKLFNYQSRMPERPLALRSLPRATSIHHSRKVRSVWWKDALSINKARHRGNLRKSPLDGRQRGRDGVTEEKQWLFVGRNQCCPPSPKHRDDPCTLFNEAEKIVRKNTDRIDITVIQPSARCIQPKSSKSRMRN